MSADPDAALRIAALVKQIPAFESMRLGEDGRLVRDGRPLEMNAYCRRAVAKGTELAAATGGSCTVLTLGPPTAEDCLREAVAWGAERGVLVTDPAFAGSDTLATARALAAALAAEGPFDLILLGRNSVDADTGQVPPQIAHLLDLPFAAGVRHLHLADGAVEVTCEHDDEWVTQRITLPAVLSVAERLCDPCKRPAEARAAVDPSRLTTVSAAALGQGPWGAEASPTWVGEVRTIASERACQRLEGPLEQQVADAVRLLVARGALVEAPPTTHRPAVPEQVGPGPVVGVLVEPERPHLTAELLGAAAGLATTLGGRVVALGPELVDARTLGGQGADALVHLTGSEVEEDLAAAVAHWAGELVPWAVLAPGTAWGRDVAARVAAALGAGLTGDAVALEVVDGRLRCWKPAFGGAAEVAIGCRSAVQLATVRPGVLAVPVARRPFSPPVEVRSVEARGRVTVVSRTREDDSLAMALADRVIGVGQGVAPERYGDLEELRTLLGAEYAATRKVTDQGWMPRARQVGITGHAIAPHLFISLGSSGKFNHTSGIRRAGTVLGVNPDPEAPLWDHCDVGITATWEDAVPLLHAHLASVLDAAASIGPSQPTAEPTTDQRAASHG
jgi:electron transfer flavoprotein alpha subunit